MARSALAWFFHAEPSFLSRLQIRSVCFIAAITKPHSKARVASLSESSQELLSTCVKFNYKSVNERSHFTALQVKLFEVGADSFPVYVPPELLHVGFFAPLILHEIGMLPQVEANYRSAGHLSDAFIINRSRTFTLH